MKRRIINVGALMVIAMGATLLGSRPANATGQEVVAVAQPHCCTGGGITCCGANGCQGSGNGCSYW